MDLLETHKIEVWRNEGYKEEYKFLEGLGFNTLTLEHVPVYYEHDKNLSTSFQMRHVVDSKGNRGFMCYVERKYPYIDSFRQGTSKAIYNEVKRMGVIMQQEELRQTWLLLNRK